MPETGDAAEGLYMMCDETNMGLGAAEYFYLIGDATDGDVGVEH